MIVWLSKKFTGRPNDQRARIDEIVEDKLHVTMLGDDMKLIVSPHAVCGVELSDLPNEITLRWPYEPRVTRTTTAT